MDASEAFFVGAVGPHPVRLVQQADQPIPESGVTLATLHFRRNLQMGPISWSVYPLQAFTASCNVML